MVAGTAALLAYGNNAWWKEGFRSNFTKANEAWFGQNTKSGGADKLGHAFSSYVGMRGLTHLFEWAGNQPGDAAKLGALTSLAGFTLVEVLDGYTTKWGFSKEDAIMNALGVGLGVLLERNPQLDALLDFRLLARPNRTAGCTRWHDCIGKYSNQTYLLVAKASGLTGIDKESPLRYLEFAVGYGTRGYEAGPGAPQNHSRHFYMGISINLSELLQRSSSGRDSRAHAAARGFLEVFQIPGTAALGSHRL